MLHECDLFKEKSDITDQHAKDVFNWFLYWMPESSQVQEVKHKIAPWINDLDKHQSELYQKLVKSFKDEFKENKHKHVNDLKVERIKEICHQILGDLFTKNRIDK